MTSALNKSRPEYVPLKADPYGTRLGFFTSGATGEDRANALACHRDGSQYPQRGSPLWQIARRS